MFFRKEPEPQLALEVQYEPLDEAHSYAFAHRGEAQRSLDAAKIEHAKLTERIRQFEIVVAGYDAAINFMEAGYAETGDQPSTGVHAGLDFRAAGAADLARDTAPGGERDV